MLLPFRWSLGLLLSILLSLPLATHAQTEGPYYLSLKRELLYGGLATGSVVFGNALRARTPDIVLGDLHLGNIPAFDRVSTRLSSESARAASDYTVLLSGGLPAALLLAGKKTRKDALQLGILFAETLTLNSGLTEIIKSTALRPRPYVFDEDLPPSTVIRSNDRAAFLSGHTSMSAAGGFFFARVFSDYHPDSKFKPYAWALGAGLPAITGYLRIRAGQHYPSDVLTGYALGAAIGYLVPTLHKRLPVTRRLTLVPAGTGLYCSYRF